MKTNQDLALLIVEDLFWVSHTAARMIGIALIMIYRGEY